MGQRIIVIYRFVNIEQETKDLSSKKTSISDWRNKWNTSIKCMYVYIILPAFNKAQKEKTNSINLFTLSGWCLFNLNFRSYKVLISYVLIAYCGGVHFTLIQPTPVILSCSGTWKPERVFHSINNHFIAAPLKLRKTQPVYRQHSLHHWWHIIQCHTRLPQIQHYLWDKSVTSICDQNHDW